MTKSKKHNKVVSIKKGDLKDIIQVSIINESTLLMEIEDGLEVKIEGSLYDWFKENKDTTPLQFSTTMGNYDVDYLKWYAVIDRETDTLMIIERDELEGLLQ